MDGIARAMPGGAERRKARRGRGGRNSAIVAIALLAERTGWTLDYIYDMPLPQLDTVLLAFAEIDRLRGGTRG